jgi:hypothetical protein
VATAQEYQSLLLLFIFLVHANAMKDVFNNYSLGIKVEVIFIIQTEILIRTCNLTRKNRENPS